MGFDSNSKIWKYAVLAAASVAGGTAVGIAVDKATSRTSYEDLVDEYESSSEWDIPEGVNVVEEDRWDDRVPMDKVATSDIFVKPDISTMTDYTKFYRGSDSDGDKPILSVDEPGIEEIDEAEFVRSVGNEDGYVTVTGAWFTQDKILAGWDSSMEEKDVHATIGEKSIKKFDDPEVKAIYVKNDILKVLYEIIRYDDPFGSVMQDTLVEDSADPKFDES